MTDSMEVLGWTLVHFCWQATVIALLYRMADLAFAKSRSHVRYSLALIAMMSMLGVALVTLGYEGMQAAHRRELQPTAITALRPEIQGHAPIEPGIAPGVETGVARQAGRGVDLVGYIVNAMPWLDAMWLAGVVILSVRTAGGWYLIRRLRRSGLVEVPAEVSDIFARLVQRIGIGRKIEIYISEHISGPLAMGVLRLVVLLPVSALTHLSPGQLEVVLAHELAHIRRGDYLWNMVQTVVETLFFFHPAVWWVSGNLRQQRELCCDDAALACCSDPLVYATALLCLEEQRGSKMRLAMALDGHQSGLKARIVRILGETPERCRQMAPLSLVGICAMLSLFLLPLPRLFADHAVTVEPMQAAAAAVIVPQSTHIAGQQAPKDKSTTVLLQAPAAPAASVVQPTPVPMLQAEPPAPVAQPTPAPVAVSAAAPAPRPAPIPAISVTVSRQEIWSAMALAVQVSKTLPPLPALAKFEMQQDAATASAKSDYINEMRAAGYGADLDKLIEMKIHGITPEYARSMQELGYGKPTAQELIQLKIFDVTQDYVKGLTAAGLKPTKLQDLISYRIFKVTPEFVAGMKAAGFTDIPPSKLVELRVHGITPESAKATKQQFPEVTLDQLIQLHIFHIDEAFIASAKRHGFEQLTIEKLVKLRISGLLDDSDQKTEKK